MASGKFGAKFMKTSLRASNALTEHCMIMHSEDRTSGELQYHINKAKSLLPGRTKGLGRPYKCFEYPELTKIMFALFHASGQGFSSHPNLSVTHFH